MQQSALVAILYMLSHLYMLAITLYSAWYIWSSVDSPGGAHVHLIQYMVARPPNSTHKWHLNQFICFCGTHPSTDWSPKSMLLQYFSVGQTHLEKSLFLWDGSVFHLKTWFIGPTLRGCTSISTALSVVCVCMLVTYNYKSCKTIWTNLHAVCFVDSHGVFRNYILDGGKIPLWEGHFWEWNWEFSIHCQPACWVADDVGIYLYTVSQHSDWRATDVVGCQINSPSWKVCIPLMQLFIYLLWLLVKEVVWDETELSHADSWSRLVFN